MISILITHSGLFVSIIFNQKTASIWTQNSIIIWTPTTTWHNKIYKIFIKLNFFVFSSFFVTSTSNWNIEDGIVEIHGENSVEIQFWLMICFDAVLTARMSQHLHFSSMLIIWMQPQPPPFFCFFVKILAILVKWKKGTQKETFPHHITTTKLFQNE